MKTAEHSRKQTNVEEVNTTTASNASSLAEEETEKEAKVEIQEAVITAAIHEKDKDEEDMMQEVGQRR